MSGTTVPLKGGRSSGSRRNKALWLIITVVIIAAAAGGAYAYYSGATSASRAPILIGLEAPLSGSYAPSGEQVLQGAELAVAQINSRGGVLGHPLKIIAQDEGPTTSTAIQAAQILVTQDHVQFLIGPYWSGDVAAVMPYLYQHHVLEILTVSAVDSFMTPPYNAYTFRVGEDDHQNALLGVAFLNMTHAGTFVYLGEDYLWTHEVYNFTLQMLPQYGVNSTLLWAAYYPGTATDYSSAIARIAATHPGAVLVYMSGENSVDFIKQYVSNPATRNIPVLLVDTPLILPSYAQSVQAAVPGGINYVFIGAPSDYVPGVTDKFFALTQEEYGYSSSIFAPDAYDAVMILAGAIQGAGTTNTTAVARAMMATDYTGPGGHVVFTPQHTPVVGYGYKTGTIYQVVIRNGAIYDERVWPPYVANFTAVNPATGQPYR